MSSLALEGRRGIRTWIGGEGRAAASVKKFDARVAVRSLRGMRGWSGDFARRPTVL